MAQDPFTVNQGQQPPDIPDLSEFQKRVEDAAGAVEDFASAVGSSSASMSQTVPAPDVAPQIDPSMMADLVNIMHLVHDEVSAIRQALDRLAG